jgi:hypothetical protein
VVARSSVALLLLAAEGRRQTGMASDNSADFGGSQFVTVEHVHVNHWGMQGAARQSEKP